MVRRILLLGALLVMLPCVASAQETQHGGLPTDLGPPRADALVDPTMARSWLEGPPRTFAALTLDAGYLYLRPRVAVGHGKPFNRWVGVEANPIAANVGLGAYGGARFSLPWVDLRVGARYFSSFRRRYLEPQETIDRLEIDRTDARKAQYVTLESELTAAIPAGPGDVLALGSISYVVGVPRNEWVFEETLRVVVDPPFVWRGRLGYLLRFGSHDQHSMGPVVEILHVPARDDSRTVRAGPVLRLQLSRHFDIRGSFVVSVSSPDRLGLVGGDFTELGVRYRTATD